MSRLFGHAHLWYHVRYRSIENVWQTATMVSIYKHSARITVYPPKTLDIGCPENSLQVDTFHV